MVDRITSGPRKNARTIGCLLLVLLLLGICLAACPASAKVLTYNEAAGTGSVQELINTSTSGDSVLLGPGKYPGNIVIDRAITFGALDNTSPPEIVSTEGLAGITIAADNSVVDGVTVSGNARSGILIQSTNNRISNASISGLAQGIVMRSAVNNEISHNRIINNSIGIEEDRGSYSNTFSLNYFDNTVETASSSNDDLWSSRPWEYRYEGKVFTGMLGNFWKEYRGSDSNGDGIGDTPYAIQNTGPGGLGVAGLIDRSPLVKLPELYTPIQVGNLTAGTGPGGQRLQDNLGPVFAQGNPGGPPNPVFGFITEFWWIIPIAIIVSVFAGIRYERSRKRQVIPRAEDQAAVLRNVTVVTKTVRPAETGVVVHQHYAAHLPPALAAKYPDAEYLAEGGASRVFVAWDGKEHRKIAVKVPIRFDEVTGSQFTKELHIWQGLHHKNIVEIYAANIFPVPYIEMEYIRSSLAAMKFPLPVGRAAEIARGVAEGLRYAHAQGIVHRDIKPENILIAPDDTPKITDWGLSKTEGTKQSGMIGFSLDYAAPEQLAPNIYGEPGPWTDIYQLGVLFYEMLSGEVPFRGGGMGEVTHAILHDDPVPLELAGPDADRIRNIVMRCMAKRPADRYGSVDELIAELEKISTLELE